jgi:PAS domain S-box-containing protein
VSTFDGEVLEANPAMVKMLGFSSREEALSVPAVDNYYDSLDREGFISALKKGVVRGYETRFRHREGSLLWVSQTALVQFIREGEKRILVVLEDISERKTNELELERHRKHLEELVDERTTELRQAKEAAEEAHRSLIHSQERLELALKGGDLGFWDVNLITGEMVVNRRWGEMFGYAPDALDNLTRETWIGSLHPDDKDRVLQAGEAYRKGQIETYEVEYQVTTMSGEIRWQFSKGEYVERDEEHGALRMVGTVMDITDRKKAEEKLKQYMEELERFNRLAVGREKQIISLKQAINALLGQLGQEPKYKSVE